MRWYGLPKIVTGVVQWEKARLQKESLENVGKIVRNGVNKLQLIAFANLDALCQKTIYNIHRCRYARTSDVNKVSEMKCHIMKPVGLLVDFSYVDRYLTIVCQLSSWRRLRKC